MKYGLSSTTTSLTHRFLNLLQQIVVTIAIAGAITSCSTSSPPRVTQPATSDAAGDLNAIAAIYHSGDFRTAAAKLEQYLTSNPNAGLGWTILGNSYEELDEDEKAKAAYQRALEVSPKQVAAITGLGIISRKEKDYDQAMAYYKQAVAIDPEYAQAYSSMTVIALKQYKDKEALEYARAAYDLEKTDPVIVANLAIAYHYNGQFDQRDKMTEEAEQLGYDKVDRLQRIYNDELTIRD